MRFRRQWSVSKLRREIVQDATPFTGRPVLFLRFRWPSFHGHPAGYYSGYAWRPHEMPVDDLLTSRIAALEMHWKYLDTYPKADAVEVDFIGYNEHRDLRAAVAGVLELVNWLQGRGVRVAVGRPE